MTALLMLSGWAVAAWVCGKWSHERTKRMGLELTKAALLKAGEDALSLNRSLLSANAEKDAVIDGLVRERVNVLSDRMFALMPADDRADAWSRYEAM